MDKRIFITLIAVILLIGAFIGIRSMLSNHCEIPEITIDPALPEAGQLVKFSCSNSEENISWNFGDGKTSSGASVEHLYEASGVYNVVAKVDNECSNTKEVTIRDPRKVVTIAPVINIPSEIHAGEEAKFSETSSGASIRKWTLKETNETKEGESFSTTFKNQGIYHLAVSVSGNYVIGDSTFAITVLRPKPVVKTGPSEEELAARRLKQQEDQQRAEDARRRRAEENKNREANNAPKAKAFLNDAEFTAKFEQVVKDLGPDNKDKGQASDDWRDVISKQVCSGQFLQIGMLDETGKQTLISDTDFRRRLMTGQTSEVIVSRIERGKDNCISKILIKARNR